MKSTSSAQRHFFCFSSILALLLFSLSVVCGVSGRSAMAASENLQAASFGTWTWVSGDKKVKKKGSYGTQGVATEKNTPGARMYAAGWVDSQDNLWLFGGHGYSSKSSERLLNDLWKFDGTNWTWVSGGKKGNDEGVYGTKGVAAAGNMPGARMGAVTWKDAQGNVWLFGGYGYATHNYAQLLDDLWKFDGKEWTWVSGDCVKDRSGVYGTLRVAGSANQPGARKDAVGWTDAQGNLWLFGGAGIDAYGNEGYLNDLWVFDGANWMWVSGLDGCNYGGVYGTQGVVGANNKPGARFEPLAWTDNKDGFLWLFGGNGVDGYGNVGQMNDLWIFNGNWIWVGGDPKYSTQFVSEATDFPAARSGSICWYDAGGNLWVFGGNANTKSGGMGGGQGGGQGGGGGFDASDSGGFSMSDISVMRKIWDMMGYDEEVSTITDEDVSVISAQGPAPEGGGGGMEMIGGGDTGAGKMSSSQGGGGGANDLWKFDGTSWTRIFAPASQKERKGTYGKKGVTSGTDWPGARISAVSWIDSKGTLWLFGGEGVGGYRNDLWKFEPNPTAP